MKRSAALLAVLVVAGCGGGSGGDSRGGEVRIGITVLRHGDQVLALVPVTIDGKGPWAFALDTGASQSLVDTQVARELRVEKTTATRQRIAGVNSVTKVAAIHVKRWQVGKVALPPTTIVEANLPFGNADGGVQGLLGSDMLSQFDVVTIDYGRSVLVLHHRAPVKSPG